MKVCGKDIKVDGRFVRVARLAAEGFEWVDPQTALPELEKSHLRADIFTFTQKVPHTSPEHNYFMEWDNIAALNVTTYDDWWNQTIDSKTRNMVRKAEKKGVVVREVPFDDAMIRGISAVFNETPVRQGRPFWHYGKDLNAIARENGTFVERSVFIGAFLEGNLIGFSKLVIREDNGQAGMMQIISMIGHRDKAPTNALMAQAVRSCAERGIPYLSYARFSYGKKQRSSLADFKESNGFKQIDLPRYYVPLNFAGRVALRLGMHHSLANRIPESVLAKLRQIRGLWHTNNLTANKESA